MRKIRRAGQPAIPQGMAGFLFVLSSRNKTFYIVISYVVLACYAVFCLVPAALAIDASSSAFNLGSITFLNGGGLTSSVNNNADMTALGENAGSLEQSLSDLFGAIAGQLYLLVSLGENQLGYLIKDLTAKTNPEGSLIPAATWQKDNDPYFYWQIQVVPPELIGGFSVSLDQTPDFVVDTSATNYQFAENSIASGKHIFYVLPYTSGKVWDEKSRLSFEIWVDVDAPVVNQLQPAPGSITTNNLIPVSCSLVDEHSGLDLLATTLTINNQQAAFDYDAEKQILTFNPTAALGEGRNNIFLRAADAVGNSTLKSWDFIVDTQAPTGSILINSGQEVTNSAYVFINIDAIDAVTGVKNIYVSNDGIFDTELNNPYPYAPVIANWQLNEPDVNGLKTVYVKLQDAVGNISSTYKDDITLELRTPDTRIISGPQTLTENKDATFIYEASKDGCLFSYKLDDAEWSGWSGLSQVDFSGLADGNHYFYVKSGFDLNGDGNITIDEEDATPAQWVWTVGPKEVLDKLRERILFWRR